MQAAFDAKPASLSLVDYSVHDVAAVLKRFVRELPQPVFTARLQSMFFAALGTSSHVCGPQARGPQRSPSTSRCSWRGGRPGHACQIWQTGRNASRVCSCC